MAPWLVRVAARVHARGPRAAWREIDRDWLVEQADDLGGAVGLAVVRRLPRRRRPADTRARAAALRRAGAPTAARSSRPASTGTCWRTSPRPPRCSATARPPRCCTRRSSRTRGCSRSSPAAASASARSQYSLARPRARARPPRRGRAAPAPRDHREPADRRAPARDDRAGAARRAAAERGERARRARLLREAAAQADELDMPGVGRAAPAPRRAAGWPSRLGVTRRGEDPRRGRCRAPRGGD